MRTCASHSESRRGITDRSLCQLSQRINKQIWRKVRDRSETRKAERTVGVWTLVLLVLFSAPENHLPSALSSRTSRFCCRRPATLTEPRGRMEVSDEVLCALCDQVPCSTCVIIYGQQTETTKERSARAMGHSLTPPLSSSFSSSSSSPLHPPSLRFNITH